MRKIIVIEFMSLDSVIQAPGAPKEDPSGGFKFGGWTAPYMDDASGKMMQKQMQPAEYLLGRTTFEIWENYWPEHADVWPAINDGMKYVFSKSRTDTEWKNTVFISSVTEIEKLKKTDGADLQVWGSSQLAQLLLKHDLVDELWLKIFPVTLGSGKKLFGEGTIPAAFQLTENSITPSGVIFANYQRAGEVKTGSLE